MEALDPKLLKAAVEAALLAAGQPLSVAQLGELFPEAQRPNHTELAQALEALALECADRGIELKEVASGFRFQVKADVHAYVSQLWTERQTRYSRALMETLALIAYRQPITRGEIEAVRGVAVSTQTVKTLEEREWVRVVGHRDVPGRPALYGTTRQFLDYFNLRSLDELPTLAEIRDLDALEPQLDFPAEGAVVAAVAADDSELAPSTDSAPAAVDDIDAPSSAESPAPAPEHESAASATPDLLIAAPSTETRQ